MALLIYKQWHSNPNRKGTPDSNADHLKYIGKRIHVLKKDGNENGLFGKFQNSFSDNISLKQAKKYIREFSCQGKTVFRSCISFTSERAKMLELDKNLSRWEEYVKYHMFSIAKNNGIGLRDIEYLAAVHLKEGQPHVHIVFWDKNQNVGKNFVNPECCNQIREDLEKDTFSELAAEMNIEEENKNLLSNPYYYTIDNGDNVRKSLITLTFGNERKVEFDIQNKMMEYFVCQSENAVDEIRSFPELSKIIEEIAGSVPKRGRLAYGYMPQEVKEKINGLSDKIMETFPELKEFFNGYLLSKKHVAEMYNSTDTPYGRLQTQTAVGKAKDKLYNKLGNIILKAVSSYKLQLKVQKQAEYEQQAAHRQEVRRNIQVVNLTASLCRLLCQEFANSRKEAAAVGAGKMKRDIELSKAARQEIIYENKDKEDGRSQ